MKQKVRREYRLKLEKELKQHKKLLWQRTRDLKTFLNPDEITSMQKAGLISAQQHPGQKDNTKDETEDGYVAEEKKLKQRLQMLLNLISFWSRRLEQAGIGEARPLPNEGPGLEDNIN